MWVNTAPRTCSQYDKYFIVGAHRQHIKIEHGGKTFKCAHYQTRLAAKTDVFKHLEGRKTRNMERSRKQVKQRKFKCEKCYKTYPSKEGLNQHIIFCHTPPQKCGQCDKYFTVRALQQHIKLVHGERVFECAHCQKRFPRKVDIAIHLQSCKNRQFNQAKEQAKQFKCDKCDKTYRNKQSLSTHNSVYHKRHEKCPQCDKYMTVGALQLHIKVVHDKKTFECAHCRKRFAIKRNLRRHLIELCTMRKKREN